MTLANLDHAFEQNLASYVDANSTASPSDFKVKRELDIARHALEESLTLHSMVTQMLKTSIAKLGKTEQDLFKLISLANNLEERHRKLQSAAKTVSSIAKQGAEIESLLASKLDAAQVYSIIVQLPQLLLTLVENVVDSHLKERDTLDAKVLANTIANRFNDEVEKSVNVLTYGGHSHAAHDAEDSANSRGIAVVEQQVVAMLQSVPVDTVVHKHSPEAEVLRRENAVNDSTSSVAKEDEF